MKTSGLSLVAIGGALVSLALFSAGCSGTTTTDAGSTTDSGGNPQDSGNNGMDSGNPGMDSGTPDAGPMDAGNPTDAGTDAGTLDCNDYCTTIMAACTGANAQFTATTNCMNYCASWPTGTYGDSSADLGCHDYHAHAAATGNATLHCPHAGPSGGGICGTLCENFCLGEGTICPGNPYANAGACSTACTGFATASGTYNDSSFQTGNTDFCRVYHLTAAAGGATAAATHCPHTAVTSAICQ